MGRVAAEVGPRRGVLGDGRTQGEEELAVDERPVGVGELAVERLPDEVRVPHVVQLGDVDRLDLPLLLEVVLQVRPEVARVAEADDSHAHWSLKW